MEIKLDIMDCIQNAGLAEEDFKSQCEGMPQTAVAIVGRATDAPTRFKLLDCGKISSH